MKAKKVNWRTKLNVWVKMGCTCEIEISCEAAVLKLKNIETIILNLVTGNDSK